MSTFATSNTPLKHVYMCICVCSPQVYGPIEDVDVFDALKVKRFSVALFQCLEHPYYGCLVCFKVIKESGV